MVGFQLTLVEAPIPEWIARGSRCGRLGYVDGVHAHRRTDGVSSPLWWRHISAPFAGCDATPSPSPSGPRSGDGRRWRSPVVGRGPALAVDRERVSINGFLVSGMSSGVTPAFVGIRAGHDGHRRVSAVGGEGGTPFSTWLK